MWGEEEEYHALILDLDGGRENLTLNVSYRGLRVGMQPQVMMRKVSMLMGGVRKGWGGWLGGWLLEWDGVAYVLHT